MKTQMTLLELQKAVLREQKQKIREMKGGVLVVEVPKSCAGYVMMDKHYITPEAMNVNVLGLLNN